MRTTTLRAVRAAAALLLAVLASGCQAQLRIEVVADRDGAGRLSIALGADAALQAEAAAAGVDPLGDLAETGARLRETAGWRVEDTVDADGGRTVRLSAPFANAEELERLAAEVAEALAGPELVPLEDLQLAVEEDVLRLSAVAGLVPTEEVTALGVQPEQAVKILRDTEAFVYEVHVQLAGEVLETNGEGGEDGAPLLWRIPPGERVALVAVTERPAPAWVPFALVGGGAAVALAAVATFALARRAARR